MDQHTKEYFERKLLGLMTKEDLEKWRQETKSNFRQLREENKNQILEWREELRTEIEQLRKENRMEIGPIQEEIKQGLQKSRIENQSVLDQSNQFLTAALQSVKEEVRSAIGQSKQEVDTSLRLIHEEGISNIIHMGKEMRTDFGELRDTLNGFGEEIKKVAEQVVMLNEKIEESFIEVKDELGSMIKFSFADLEKKLNALEARIKALEKMVFP